VTVVLDASMTVAWLFATERTEIPRATLRRVAANGAIVPSLWRLEVANVLRNAVRRGRCDEAYASRCLQRLARLRIVVDAETDLHAWGNTRRVASAHNLTLYDAAYLELSLRRQRPLASCDAALLIAAQTAGVDVLGP
jgi:predicted nucleic acid-binding protein